MSSGTEGVLYGGARRLCQPAGDAGRAGDEVDGELGDGVPQRLHRVGGEPFPGAEPGAGRGAGSASAAGAAGDAPGPAAVTGVALRASVVMAAPAGPALSGSLPSPSPAGSGQRCRG